MEHIQGELILTKPISYIVLCMDSYYLCECNAIINTYPSEEFNKWCESNNIVCIECEEKDDSYNKIMKVYCSDKEAHNLVTQQKYVISNSGIFQTGIVMFHMKQPIDNLSMLLKQIKECNEVLYNDGITVLLQYTNLKFFGECVIAQED